MEIEISTRPFLLGPLFLMAGAHATLFNYDRNRDYCLDLKDPHFTEVAEICFRIHPEMNEGGDEIYYLDAQKNILLSELHRTLQVLPVETSFSNEAPGFRIILDSLKARLKFPSRIQFYSTLSERRFVSFSEQKQIFNQHVSHQRVLFAGGFILGNQNETYKFDGFKNRRSLHQDSILEAALLTVARDYARIAREEFHLSPFNPNAVLEISAFQAWADTVYRRLSASFEKVGPPIYATKIVKPVELYVADSRDYCWDFSVAYPQAKLQKICFRVHGVGQDEVIWVGADNKILRKEPGITLLFLPKRVGAPDPLVSDIIEFVPTASDADSVVVGTINLLGNEGDDRRSQVARRLWTAVTQDAQEINSIVFNADDRGTSSKPRASEIENNMPDAAAIKEWGVGDWKIYFSFQENLSADQLLDSVKGSSDEEHNIAKASQSLVKKLSKSEEARFTRLRWELTRDRPGEGEATRLADLQRYIQREFSMKTLIDLEDQDEIRERFGAITEFLERSSPQVLQKIFALSHDYYSGLIGVERMDWSPEFLAKVHLVVPEKPLGKTALGRLSILSLQSGMERWKNFLAEHCQSYLKNPEQK